MQIIQMLQLRRLPPRQPLLTLPQPLLIPLRIRQRLLIPHRLKRHLPTSKLTLRPMQPWLSRRGFAFDQKSRLDFVLGSPYQILIGGTPLSVLRNRVNALSEFLTNYPWAHTIIALAALFLT